MPLSNFNQGLDLTAQNTFVGPNSMGIDDSYSVSITGNFTGTVAVLRSLDGGATYGILDSVTAPAEIGGKVTSGCLIKAGIPAGSFSGTAHVILKVGQ